MKENLLLVCLQGRGSRDICIAPNGMLLSKAIRAVSIDRPRKIGRINNSTGSRAFLTQV